MQYSLFLSAAKGLESLLTKEAETLGLRLASVTAHGVSGQGTLKSIYELALWSRLASRLHLVLFEKSVKNAEELYDVCRIFPWHHYFHPDKTIACEFHGTSSFIRHTGFGAQRIKDAIVDTFREKTGKRPSVDPKNPNILIHAHLKKGKLTLSIDLIGRSLHRRGYRLLQGEAPLKETVACGMLLRADWPALCKAGYTLIDPFCGAGTLVIEAAMIAENIAPGLLSPCFSFEHLSIHDACLWETVKQNATQKKRVSTAKILGSDIDRDVVQKATSNATRAGVISSIQLSVNSFEAMKSENTQGIIVSNPPYGERLAEETTLLPLYQSLGRVLHEKFSGWSAYFSIANPLLSRKIGLRSHQQYTLYHGAIPCKLYAFHLTADNHWSHENKQAPLSSQAMMFANRLKKNVNFLKKWAIREKVHCYRLYDADLPEYAFAIDWYDGNIIMQEYQAPKTIPHHQVTKHRLEVQQVLRDFFNLPPNKLILKERKRQKGLRQYEKLNTKSQYTIIQEGAAKLLVNLHDYLDTGLFLDLRKLRTTLLNHLPPQARFLNCFCYTATASVHAALSGAITTNVDLSNTYLRWAEENFLQNQLSLKKHQFIQYDYLEWVTKTNDTFDVILLDPPIFSNSKRMNGTFDIVRDHRIVIEKTMALLKPKGVLYFCVYASGFKLDSALFSRYHIKNITPLTLDLDFKRSPGSRLRYQLTHCL